MSDGGAQVVVESVSLLARFRLGRGLLWLVAAYLVVTAVSARAGDRELLVFAAVALGLVALVAGFFAERKRRAERASFRQALVLWGLVVVSVVAGSVLLFRRKAEPLPPPDPNDVDRALGGG